MTWPSLPESTICLPRAKCSQLRLLGAGLDDLLRRLGELQEGVALLERVRDGLLQVDVLARRDCVGRHLQVPVVGAPDHDRVDVLVVQDASVVGVLRRPGPRDLGRLEHARLVDVAHRDELAAGQLLEQAHQVPRAAAGADDADPDAVVGAEGRGRTPGERASAAPPARVVPRKRRRFQEVLFGVIPTSSGAGSARTSGTLSARPGRVNLHHRAERAVWPSDEALRPDGPPSGGLGAS